MLCILYMIAVGCLLGTAALQVERILPPGASRRWVWCVAMLLSVALPPLYFARHRVEMKIPVGGVPSHSAHSGVWEIGGWASHLPSSAIVYKLWIAASCLIALWGLLSVVRVWLILASSRKGVVVGEVGVILTDSAGPATVGVFHPRVLVPKWVLALPCPERGFVLRHEEEHRRARDAALLTMASFILVLLPWNVALWWQLRRLYLAIEMDCDSRVVAALGDAARYATLLLRVAEAGTRGPSLQPALLGGTGMLEERLKSLISPVRLEVGKRCALALFAAALALVVAIAPHPVTVTSTRPPAHVPK